jgi:2-isopropylmalate synthase
MGMGMKIEIYDTTLRDGTQGEGISLSVADKLKIAVELDRLGVDFIEGGWPGSNPKDAEFFRRAVESPWRHATICAFGSTRRAHGAVEADANLRALLESQAPVLTLVCKSSVLHVREVLETTLEENLAMIRDSVLYLRGQGRRVIHDAEHFFDGFALDPEYALATLRAALDAGVERLVLCDTNGGTLTGFISEAVHAVRAALGEDVPLGIHTHNDAELAVANTLAGVEAGARQVQGTINGYGERCGNANLCSIIPTLQLKMGYECVPPESLHRLTSTAHFVAEVANAVLDNQKAYVGHSAFAHKGGIHVAAMRKTAHSYQHVDPALVGNEQRVLISELSGRGNVLALVDQGSLVGPANGYRPDATQTATIVARIKDLESHGYQFEGAEASVELMIQRANPAYTAPFDLLDFLVVTERRGDMEVLSEATVKVKVGDTVLHTAADGDGPVNALDRALRKALIEFYPELAGVRLQDYKVRIVDGAMGTAAVTRVLIESANERRVWTTVGSSSNIIEASQLALADALAYAILEARQQDAATGPNGAATTEPVPLPAG